MYYVRNRITDAYLDFDGHWHADDLIGFYELTDLADALLALGNSYDVEITTGYTHN